MNSEMASKMDIKHSDAMSADIQQVQTATTTPTILDSYGPSGTHMFIQLCALNQGWIADKISRRYSIVVAVIIFTLGSSLQTASVDYPMLVAARFIRGVGIGM